jgi:hypothetical protein
MSLSGKQLPMRVLVTVASVRKCLEHHTRGRVNKIRMKKHMTGGKSKGWSELVIGMLLAVSMLFISTGEVLAADEMALFQKEELIPVALKIVNKNRVYPIDLDNGVWKVEVLAPEEPVAYVCFDYKWRPENMSGGKICVEFKREDSGYRYFRKTFEK